MDYQEQLQNLNHAETAGDRDTIESIKSSMETDRATQENMGNSMVIMAAEQALEKLTKKQQDTTHLPEWRVDQALRTGGNAEELEKKTHEVNERLGKSILLGRKNILSAIPVSLRTPAQRSELLDIDQKLQEIGVAISYEPEQLNVAKNILETTSGALDTYQDHMASQIATGGSLWDIPGGDNDDEPISFTQPIQPSAEQVDETHKEYLRNEIGTIGAAISAGFGNEQALNRGIELEKKLDAYNQPKITESVPEPVQESKDSILDAVNQVPETIATPEADLFTTTISSLTRDDLGKVYGLLQQQGSIDGQSPDQVWAAVKLFMRGASDDTHIPESYGLRAKMNEIKNIRDAELAHHGIVIDKESGAAEVQKVQPIENKVVETQKTVETTTPPEMTDLEKSPEVLQNIQKASTLEELKNVLQSVRVLHDGDKKIDTFIPAYILDKYIQGEVDDYEITNIGRIRDQVIKIKLGVVPPQVPENVQPENNDEKNTQPEIVVAESTQPEAAPIPTPDQVVPPQQETLPDQNQKKSPEDLFEEQEELMPDFEKTELVNKSISLDNLIKNIELMKGVQGSQEFFTPEMIKIIITRLKIGKSNINDLPRSYGLREKVAKLLDVELAQPDLMNAITRSFINMNGEEKMIETQRFWDLNRVRVNINGRGWNLMSSEDLDKLYTNSENFRKSA